MNNFVIFFLIWGALGLIFFFRGIYTEYKRGNDLTLGDILPLLFLSMLIGPVGLIFMLLDDISYLVEKWSKLVILKGKR